MLTQDELNNLKTANDEVKALQEKRRAHAYERRMQGATFAEIGAELNVSVTQASQLMKKEQGRRMLAEQRGEIDPFSVRTRNCLLNHGVPFSSNGLPDPKWLAENETQKSLLETPNMGRKSLNELIEWMKGKGYHLPKDESDGKSTSAKHAARMVRQALWDYPPAEDECVEDWLRRLEGRA